MLQEPLMEKMVAMRLQGMPKWNAIGAANDWPGDRRMANLSMRAYARRRGVALAAVQKAIADGRIVMQPDGRIDPEIADVQWAETTRWGASNIMNGADVGGDSSGHKPSEYAAARAERERYAALLARLKYEERAGGLVRKDQVEEELFRTFRAFRDRLQTVPDRVAGILAGETDAAVIHQVLADEIETALNDFADQPSVPSAVLGQIR
jgi:hypothetical protein